MGSGGFGRVRVGSAGFGYIVITDSSNYAKSVIYVYHIMANKCSSKVPDEKR